MSATVDRLKDLIYKRLEAEQPKNNAEVRAILDDFSSRMRARIEHELAEKPDLRERAMLSLAQAYEEVELKTASEINRDIAAPTSEGPRAATPQKSSLVTGLSYGLVGLVIGAVGTFAFLSNQTGTQITGIETAAAQSASVELRSFVDLLEEELTKPDTAIELPNTSSLHNVTTFWETEFEALSEAARYQLRIFARKDGEAYKILLDSPLCTYAVNEGIFEQDVRRASPFGGLCNHMSVHNIGGSEF